MSALTMLHSASRVLVAEDSAFLRELIGDQLTHLGCAHDVAHDGADALRLWRRAPARYWLLLTDLQMPALDGFELARRIRSDSSAGARLPIVAYAASGIDSAVSWRRAGIDECIAKPAELAVLRDALRRWQPWRTPPATVVPRSHALQTAVA